MKRLITSVSLSAIILASSLGRVSAAEVKQDELYSVDDGKVITIEGDLSDPTLYVDELSSLMKDPSVMRVIVIDPSLIQEPRDTVVEQDEEDTVATRGKFYTYRVVDPTIGENYRGSTMIATADGTPGDALRIAEVVKVQRTYSCNVSAVVTKTITTAVGYDITVAHEVTVEGKATVPSYHGGKAVERMYYNAYPIYQTTNFTVQRKLHNNGVILAPWEDCGSGYARNPIGASFDRVYEYK